MTSFIAASQRSQAFTPPPTWSSAAQKRKRETLAAEDSDDLLSSQGKRHRVAFDPHVEVRVMEDWNEKGLELVREEVRRALEQRQRLSFVARTEDDDEPSEDRYEQIKSLFSKAPDADDVPATSLLRKYLMALTSNVGRLNMSCAGLVHSILESQWVGRDDAFVSVYVRFLGNLLSAQHGYLGVVLKMLVSHFSNPSPLTGRVHDDAVVPRSPELYRIHATIKYLVHLMPSSSSTLASAVASSFPHIADTKKAYLAYIRNLLWMIEYAPELRAEVLDLITERLVKIDVQIQVDMEDLEDEIGESLLDPGTGGPGMEYDGEESHDGMSEADDTDEELDPEEQRVKNLKLAVEKMDATLDVLFNYYDPLIRKGSYFETESLFEQLMSQFVNVMLPTYHSRCTHFLLFRFSQSNSTFIERFSGTCAAMAFDKTRSSVIRLSAAAYLASFVARGAQVSKTIARDVFELLGTQLEEIRGSYESTCRGPDLRRYGVYYATAQALLYIFCFRWRDLCNSEGDEDADDDEFDDQKFRTFPSWISDVLRKNIYSRFNPLKVCAPSIVNQFARVAHHLQFLYVFPLLESNKRLRLSQSSASTLGQQRETALSGQVDESNFQLDAYFPFDPYRLPISRRWVDKDYNEYRGIPGLDEDDDGIDSEEDGEDGVEEDGEENTATEDESS